MNKETIVAIATPVGCGGVGVIRCSGSDTFSIINKIFSKPISDIDANRIIFGEIREENNKTIDQVLVSVFKSPKSYTGENLIEISAHGNMIILEDIIKLCIKNGARMATPGEFTLRAFLNGKMDLSQAEAVNDLIKAQTETSKNIALRQLEGKLANIINQLDRQMLEMTATIEASIDFPEDVIEPDYHNLLKKIEDIIKKIENLLKSNQNAFVFREGISMAIVGSVNVGKSSLLNNFLRKERAIVTHIAGTTRDTLEEVINIKGIPVYTVDTAGIRETEDIIEKIGIERSCLALNKSDLVLCIFDQSRPLTKEDKEIFYKTKHKKTIAVVNKIDCKTEYALEIRNFIKSNSDVSIVEISTFDNDSIDNLKDILYNSFIKSYVSTENITITNQRHMELLNMTKESLLKATETLKNQLPLDFVSIDIAGARNFLGTITGTNSHEKLLDFIFGEFCIGK